jgi:predicted ATPase
MGQLLSRAASSGVQIIVESHSDHIMNGIRVAVHQNLLSPKDAGFLYFRWNPDNQTGATEVRPVQLDPNDLRHDTQVAAGAVSSGAPAR